MTMGASNPLLEQNPVQNVSLPVVATKFKAPSFTSASRPRPYPTTCNIRPVYNRQMQYSEQNCSPRIENFRPTGFSGVSSGNILQQRLSQLKQRKQMTQVKTNLLDDSDKEFDNFSCKTEPPSILQSETDLPSELKFALDEENEGQNESFSPLTGVDSDEENVPSQISEVSQIVPCRPQENFTQSTINEIENDSEDIKNSFSFNTSEVLNESMTSSTNINDETQRNPFAEWDLE